MKCFCNNGQTCSSPDHTNLVGYSELEKLLEQAMALKINLYDSTTIDEIKVLIKHKLLDQFGEPIPYE